MMLAQAQSPLGLTFLKPLNDLPTSTLVMGGIAALFATLLLTTLARKPVSAPARFASAQVPVAPLRATSEYAPITSPREAASSAHLSPIIPLPLVVSNHLSEAGTREVASSAGLQRDIRPQAQPDRAPTTPTPTTGAGPTAPITNANQPMPVAPTRTSGALVDALGKGWVFALLYIGFMLPTYFLPYLGSNSFVANTAIVANNTTPWPFLLHLGFIVGLIWIAVIRGRKILRTWLPVFPGLAGAFDLLPGLSMIFMVPTMLHIAAVLVGSMTQQAPILIMQVPATKDGPRQSDAQTR